MDYILQFLWKCSFFQICFISAIENFLILIISLILGKIAVKIFREKQVCKSPAPINSIELMLCLSTLAINMLVTICGWFLWKEGFIQIKTSASFWIVIVDMLVLFFVMDLLMYLLHRVAHIKFLFPFLHSTHHKFTKVRPLTLFVLNPLETLSFGTLWLLLLIIYPASGFAIFIYLTINVIFGIIGHLGVEPIPKRIATLPVINLLTTSTFHAHHHQIAEHNFGFYTVIWDKLFKSLSPYYNSHFGKILPL